MKGRNEHKRNILFKINSYEKFKDRKLGDTSTDSQKNDIFFRKCLMQNLQFFFQND